jgi:hypothetical protein
MIELSNALKYAQSNISRAIEINQDSPEKPLNVNLFNHVFSDTLDHTVSKESLMIDNNIFWFPNVKSLYGAIIKNPKSQYIFCNEICDCVGIGGTIRDKGGQTHIFGAHVYESILDDQMQNIINEIIKHGSPKKVVYSPREDTSWQTGLKVLENNFLETISVIRTKTNQTEMIVGIEGIILNDKFYKL